MKTLDAFFRGAFCWFSGLMWGMALVGLFANRNLGQGMAGM